MTLKDELTEAHFLDYHHAVLGSTCGWEQEPDWRGSVVPYYLRRRAREHQKHLTRERALRSVYLKQPHIPIGSTCGPQLENVAPERDE